MPTKEQKIEKLLKDLDEYARLDFDDQYGLPCFCKYNMDKMKAIVQDFLDSLEENEAPGWTENQLDAYRAFLEVGIPDEWANAMVGLVVDDGWKYADPTAESLLSNFAVWEKTPQGQLFWQKLWWAVYNEGTSAFFKFPCPQ